VNNPEAPLIPAPFTCHAAFGGAAFGRNHDGDDETTTPWHGRRLVARSPQGSQRQGWISTALSLTPASACGRRWQEW